MATVSCPLIAVGANRHPAAADWSPCGLLAFGAGRSIALWNPPRTSHTPLPPPPPAPPARARTPAPCGVHTTLKGHADRVNAVRFLPGQPPGAGVLLSGSVDKSVRAWSRSPGAPEFAPVWISPESARTGSVNAIAACAGQPGIFASASADGTIAVYRVSSSVEITHLQSFTTAPKFYPLALALAVLPSTAAAASEQPALVLAVAGSASSIAIYVACSPAAPFIPQATLSGHENWIRSLSFTPEDPSCPASSDLILASASQDKYIRLWRIHAGEQLPAATASDETKTYGLSTRLSNKAHKLRASAGEVWSATFEALLMGHEDWVYTAAWRPTCAGDSTLQLLSASADSSLAIWTPERESGIWLTTSRLGEISDVKGASTATGAVGGLWTGLWAPDGNSVAAFGKTGSWRVWHYSPAEDRWLQGVGISGHVKEAMGCSWGRDGGYLLSAGLDQTTRLYAEWTQAGGSGSWHEFARPQIHGYDINCIASLGGSRFVSGADEKLLRVFDEPRGAAGLLEKLCGIHEESKASMPDAANVPALGLSNKAITSDAPAGNPYDPSFTPSATTTTTTTTTPTPAAGTSTSILDGLPHPPLEDHLCRHTLWPEHEKLYGHGYEISALAASPDSRIIATAAKASTAEHAVIRLFETHGWRELKPSLPAHALTVTALAFSDDSRRLLSVGRDRAWAVFENRADAWRLVERRDKAHTRMVLGAGWAPGGGAFATAGRDKCVKVWQRGPEDSGYVCVGTVKFEMPVTAVDYLGCAVGGKTWLAVGEESGALWLYAAGEEEAGKVELVCRLDDRITPDRAVTQIAWRPARAGADRREMAVSSEDGSVRVYAFDLGADE